MFSIITYAYIILVVLELCVANAQTKSPITDQTIRRAVAQWFENQPSATEKYGHISDWNTSQVTDMSQLFNSYEYPGAAEFNENITGWDTSQVTTMNLMFNGAREFNQDISSFDVSQVTDMNFLFFAAANFNQDISRWNTNKVEGMSFTFSGAREFDQDIGQWNTSSLTDIAGLFFGAQKFNRAIGSWDVSSVTTMASAFHGATSFNQYIGSWNTSQVVNLGLAFTRAASFNQPMNEWDVSNVEDMYGAFSKATSFNQRLDMWNVSSCKNMQNMFLDAATFDQILCWDLSQIEIVDDMFCGSLGSFDEICVDPIYIASSIQSCSTDAPSRTPLPTVASSLIPSPEPSAMSSSIPSSSPVNPNQSTSPTGSITTEPTFGVLPTATPTSPPITQPPTKSPTTNPSLSPSTVPSETPSTSIAPSVKFAPSITPFLSTRPTVAPTIQESLQPSVPNSTNDDGLCATDSNGDFGLITQGKSNQVDFFYQMKTTPNITISDANAIVRDIEVAINNLLLPTLFTNECGTPDRVEQTRTRWLASVGVQAVPIDKILIDVECIGGGENACFVISGGLTVVTLGDEVVNDTAKYAIESEMDNGSLNRVTDDGVGVIIEYRDDSSIPATSNNSTTGSTSDDGDKDNNNFWVWIAAGTGGGLVLGLFIVSGSFILRQRRASKLEDESFAEASWRGAEQDMITRDNNGANSMSVQEIVIQAPTDSGYSYRDEISERESIE